MKNYCFYEGSLSVSLSLYIYIYIEREREREREREGVATLRVKNIIHLFTLQVDTERNVSSLLLKKVLMV